MAEGACVVPDDSRRLAGGLELQSDRTLPRKGGLAREDSNLHAGVAPAVTVVTEPGKTGLPLPLGYRPVSDFERRKAA
jgi:hypothetical protein